MEEEAEDEMYPAEEKGGIKVEEQEWSGVECWRCYLRQKKREVLRARRDTGYGE